MVWMGNRGPKPKRRVSETWTPDLAYAMGLLATDGCLSSKGCLIDLTSKDVEQLKNFSTCIDIPLRIGQKRSGSGKRSFRVQFKSVIFYDFLLSIGLTPAKSKTLGALKIPDKYFFDFLRGVFDGDGSTYSYWDPRWKSSFMYYVCFASASEEFIAWLMDVIHARLGFYGHITHANHKSTYQLKYAKKDGIQILRKMYKTTSSVCLSRKRLKIERMLRIVGEQL
jgi:hypothetical protein